MFYYYAYGQTVEELSVYVIYPRYEMTMYLIKNIPLSSGQYWISQYATFTPKYPAYQVSSFAIFVEYIILILNYQIFIIVYTIIISSLSVRNIPNYNNCKIK